MSSENSCFHFPFFTHQPTPSSLYEMNILKQQVATSPMQVLSEMWRDQERPVLPLRPDMSYPFPSAIREWKKIFRSLTLLRKEWQRSFTPLRRVAVVPLRRVAVSVILRLRRVAVWEKVVSCRYLFLRCTSFLAFHRTSPKEPYCEFCLLAGEAGSVLLNDVLSWVWLWSEKRQVLYLEESWTRVQSRSISLPQPTIPIP